MVDWLDPYREDLAALNREALAPFSGSPEELEARLQEVQTW